jgi:hypothetical protein
MYFGSGNSNLKELDSLVERFARYCTIFSPVGKKISSNFFDRLSDSAAQCSVNRGPLSKRTPKWIGKEANVLIH